MIKIKKIYSNGGEKELIKCKTEDAWITIFNLAIEDSRIASAENEDDVIVYFDRSICEIKFLNLTYDDYYYYRIEEDNAFINEEGIA